MNSAYRHIYVHLPFCEVICHYCDFYTARASEARHEDFFAALTAEAQKKLNHLDKKIDAIYFGGGTPSASPPELLAKFLRLYEPYFHEKTEVTLEANPVNVTHASAKTWKDAGVNRISIGIQSLNNSILKKLGRVHSADTALKALETCLSVIPNVSGDLIYAVPEQTESEPSDHALKMAEIGVSHFSAYHLTLTSAHFLHAKLPTDNFAYAQLQMIGEQLRSFNFRHYEISNFARSGFESRNNQNYWHGGPYLALGPSAHGFDGKRRRWHNVADWTRYISLALANEETMDSFEDLTDEQRKIEAIFTGLRLEDGINLAEIEHKYSCRIIAGHEALFAAWKNEGLGTLDNGHFKPTFKGRMLADEIARKLL